MTVRSDGRNWGPDKNEGRFLIARIASRLWAKPFQWTPKEIAEFFDIKQSTMRVMIEEARGRR